MGSVEAAPLQANVWVLDSNDIDKRKSVTTSFRSTLLDPETNGRYGGQRGVGCGSNDKIKGQSTVA
uniref:Uncharacterized protein n=1 Tax=Romanomermis culicivorax TaxID=13658 RepID=A0A915JNL9_ROMCU